MSAREVSACLAAWRDSAAGLELASGASPVVLPEDHRAVVVVEVLDADPHVFDLPADQ
jgi:hypothetical protein